ncbi:MAG: hypothetical protein ACTTIS_02255 [Streptobacillus sp.]
MKKVILYISFLLFFSCSSIQSNRILTVDDKNNIVSEIVKVQEYIVLKAKDNNKEEIKKKIVNSFLNNIKFSYLNNYDLSNMTLLFSEDIEVVSENRAKSIMLINYELETMYFDIVWVKYNSEWKIESINPE